jgi:menaquinone-specific isochorismate synthase
VAWGLCRATTPDAPIAFYAPDFFLEDAAPWWIPASAVVLERDELLALVPEESAPAPLPWSEPSEACFREAFAEVRRWFESEGLRKAVLAAFATSPESVRGDDRWLAVARAWRLPKPFLPCGLWHDDEGFLSATPELLFRLHGRKSERTLETMALAATRPAVPTTAGNAPWTRKEREEHGLVVADLERALEPLGTVLVGPVEERVVGPMAHLHAALRCAGPALETLSLEACTRALHPTAALGVAPRSFPWRRLRELDGGLDRRRFGAPFAVRERDGSAVAVVAIRAVQWTSSGSLLASGAGILPESDRDAEWRELALKRKATREALGL